jgi:hypothetical protein
MVMGAVAHYIDEGRQPSARNVRMAYTILDLAGGLDGWAAGMLHPDHHNGFVNAMSIGGATQETITQVELYLLDWVVNQGNGVAAFPDAWANPW